MKIGPLLILGEDEALGAPRPYSELRALALAAEEAGLDSVWIYDHLFYHFPDQEPKGVWEGWTIWTALAEATRRIELGALVLCTAFRNPAVLAKMAVTLDEVSNGRVILGIGAGWHKPEFDAFGLDFTHKVDQFEEAASIIVPLVREGKVDFTGRYHSAPNCQMLPLPSRPIPVLIAGKQPRMLSLVARFADQYNTAWHGHVESTEERVANVQAALRDEGRDPSSLDLTAGVNVVFPELGTVPDDSTDRMKYVTGGIEEVAQAFREYDKRGFAHLNVMVTPHTTAAMTMLGQAAALSRSLT
ncbi:MAG: LLM class flavin-dependent oxidoreductase [Thermomicrobiales bacterium]